MRKKGKKGKEQKSGERKSICFRFEKKLNINFFLMLLGLTNRRLIEYVYKDKFG